MTFTLPPNISLTEGRKLVPGSLRSSIATRRWSRCSRSSGGPRTAPTQTCPTTWSSSSSSSRRQQWPPGVVVAERLGRTHLAGARRDPGHRSKLLAADPRQREREHLRPVRPDRVEDLRRRSRPAAGSRRGIDGAIAKVPGVADLGIVKSSEMPQLQVEPDRGALGRYGLDMEDFQHTSRRPSAGSRWACSGTARAGTTSCCAIRTRRVTTSTRSAICRVAVQGGVTVPIETLARVSIGHGRSPISRENGHRYIGMRMNVRGRDMGSFVARRAPRRASGAAAAGASL